MAWFPTLSKKERPEPKRLFEVRLVQRDTSSMLMPTPIYKFESSDEAWAFYDSNLHNEKWVPSEPVTLRK